MIFACLTKQLWKKDDEVHLFCVQEGGTDCPIGETLLTCVGLALCSKSHMVPVGVNMMVLTGGTA